MYVYTCIYVHIDMYIYTYIYVYIDMYVYTYIYVDKCSVYTYTVYMYNAL